MGHSVLGSPLIAAAAVCSGADQGAVSAMVRSLVEPAFRPQRGQSGPSILNNDGLPLQLCLSSRAEHVSVRLIGDPCTGIADPVRRIERSLERLSVVMRLSRSNGLARSAGLTVEHTLPADGGGREALIHGGLWLAVDACGRPGMALYTTLDWGDGRRDERWRRVQTWLECLLPGGAGAVVQLGSLPLDSWPISAGLEGSSESDAVAKIYIRFDGPLTPDRLSLGGVGDRHFDEFYERTVAGRPLPPTGVLLCVAFSLATGHLTSVKLDICGHCVPHTPQEWQATVDLWAGRLGVRRLSIVPLLDALPVEVAFIGLGRTGQGHYRFNLYLKALACSGPPS